MRFTIKSKHQREYEKDKRLTQWHLWFAWFPKRLDCDTVAWLERVGRRGFCINYYKGKYNFQYVKAEEIPKE